MVAEAVQWRSVLLQRRGWMQWIKETFKSHHNGFYIHIDIPLFNLIRIHLSQIGGAIYYPSSCLLTTKVVMPESLICCNSFIRI